MNMHKRPSIKSFGFDFVTKLQKQWAKKGTASYPIIFINEDGHRFKLTDDDIKTDEENKETLVQIRPE